MLGGKSCNRLHNTVSLSFFTGALVLDLLFPLTGQGLLSPPLLDQIERPVADGGVQEGSQLTGQLKSGKFPEEVFEGLLQNVFSIGLIRTEAYSQGEDPVAVTEIKDTTELISFLDQIDLSKGNIWLEIGGLFALMLSTTAMLNSLRRSLNDFYDLEKWQVSRKRRIVRGVMFRMMSVGVVTGSVLIFIVVYFLETVFLSMGGGLFSEHTWYGSFFSYVARHGLPLVTDIFLFAFIFMYINDGKVRWRRAFEGALVTGILMYLGQLLIHLYIQNFFFAAKGGMIAGVLLVVLVWVYYSSQIIFLGAKFIAVRSRMLGHEVRLRD